MTENLSGKIPVSVHLEPGASEDIVDFLPVLVRDLLFCLIHDLLPDILKGSDLAVDGTNKRRLRLRERPDEIDRKLRAALRAKGFDLERVSRHSSSPSAGDAPMVMSGSGERNAPTPVSP